VAVVPSPDKSPESGKGYSISKNFFGRFCGKENQAENAGIMAIRNTVPPDESLEICFYYIWKFPGCQVFSAFCREGRACVSFFLRIFRCLV